MFREISQESSKNLHIFPVSYNRGQEKATEQNLFHYILILSPYFLFEGAASSQSGPCTPFLWDFSKGADIKRPPAWEPSLCQYKPAKLWGTVKLRQDLRLVGHAVLS